MNLPKFGISDFEVLESANLPPDRYFAAFNALASLHFLRQVSQMLGKPIEGLTSTDIILQFAQTPETQRT